MPTNQSVYFFGNSLINFAGGNAQTNAPYWMNRFAEFEGNSFSVEGGYGFLRNFAEAAQAGEPNTDWGFEGVSEVYDSDRASFAQADFSSIIITPGNFIQDQGIDENYFDGNSSPLDAMRDIVRNMQETQPDARLFVYEGWADMGPYADPFPPTQPALDSYHAYNQGEYHAWFETMVDTVSAQTGADVTLIPVASVLSEILTTEPLSQIEVTDLYVDNAPHGTETLYFLSGLVTYGALYGTMPPPDFAVPGNVDPVVAVYFQDITEQVADVLGNYGFEVAISEATGEVEVFDFVPVVEDPSEEQGEDAGEQEWIAPIEVEPGYDTAEDLGEDLGEGLGEEPAQEAADTSGPGDSDEWIAPVEVEPGYDTDGEASAQATDSIGDRPEGEPQMVTRTIEAPTDGAYVFDLTSDDPAYLSVNGDMVLVNDGSNPDTAQQATVELEAGSHTVEIAFYEQTGGEVLILDVGPADGSEMALPETEFEDIPEEDGDEDFETF